MESYCRKCARDTIRQVLGIPEPSPFNPQVRQVYEKMEMQCLEKAPTEFNAMDILRTYNAIVKDEHTFLVQDELEAFFKKHHDLYVAELN